MRRGGMGSLLLVCLVAAGCGGGGATDAARFAPQVSYRAADPATLIRRANAWSGPSLRGDGQLRMYWSGDEDSRHVDVQFFATSTGALVMSGRRSLAGRIFDLISDGREFQLVVPDHAAHYLGTSAAPAEPDPERPYFALRPHHMTETLLPEPLPTSNSAGSWVVTETYPDRYALTWMEASDDAPRIRRRVWIDRVDLRVAEIEGFDEDGRIEFIADYSNYLGSGVDAYPGSIQVERVWEELVFRFDLEEVDRSPEIPDAAFRFQELPAGYRVLTIEEAMAEFRREGGE